MNNPPTISVLMPVRNVERYLAGAVGSVLAQTFGDFELLVFDNASTDGTAAILARLAASDPRIVPMRWEIPGYVAPLNQGIDLARGEFIARMDGDDLCLPERFAAQLDYLRSHPDCVAVGGQVVTIDSDDDPIAPWTMPVDHEAIDRVTLAGQPGIVHPTLMVRRAAVRQVGGYRAEYELCEDMDLYLRLAEVGRLANLPDLVLHYRRHPKSVSHERMDRQIVLSEGILAEARRRRGMPDAPPTRKAAPLTQTEMHRDWAWLALGAGNLGTARKHARSALRRAPMTAEVWRLAYCAFLRPVLRRPAPPPGSPG